MQILSCNWSPYPHLSDLLLSIRHAECRVLLQAQKRDSKEPNSAEGIGDAAQQERSAELQAAELPPEATQSTTESKLTLPECLPVAEGSALSSEPIPDSSSSSLSPQPTLHVLTGTSHGQQESYLPWPVAPAPSAPDAQGEEPWQKVGMSRRKPVSQQAAPKTSMCKPPQHSSGRDQCHPGTDSAASDLQRAAQRRIKPLSKPAKAPALPLQAQLLHIPGKGSTHWPTLAESRPQQPSRHGLGTVHLPRSQACPSSPQQGALQTASSSILREEAHAAFQHTPCSGSLLGSSSHEQVCTCLHRDSLL